MTALRSELTRRARTWNMALANWHTTLPLVSSSAFFSCSCPVIKSAKVEGQPFEWKRGAGAGAYVTALARVREETQLAHLHLGVVFDQVLHDVARKREELLAREGSVLVLVVRRERLVDRLAVFAVV